MKILLSTPPHIRNDYMNTLPKALEIFGLNADIVKEAAPESVDYIVYAPNDCLKDFSPFTNTKAVLSLWAGVDSIVKNETLSQPLCRMVDDGLREGMREWVMGYILQDHLLISRFQNAVAGDWQGDHVPPLAREKSVVVLGFGTLGQFVGEALRDIGFRVYGWSTTPKTVEGIVSLSGNIHDAVVNKDYVVSLLPHTAATEHILNLNLFEAMSKHALLLNAGRGAVVDEIALEKAIQNGMIRGAVLDVFATEPLPKSHPFWLNKSIIITPHIAASTRPETASEVIAENIRRFEAGESPLHLVDRKRGY